jgi:hypothetical protein
MLHERKKEETFKCMLYERKRSGEKIEKKTIENR